LAVQQIIKQKVEGHFLAGQKSFGLGDKGVDYAVDQNNAEIIKPYQAQLEKIRTQIMKGQIKVPDYYKVSKEQ
jgi:basic membrane protein A